MKWLDKTLKYSGIHMTSDLSGCFIFFMSKTAYFFFMGQKKG